MASLDFRVLGPLEVRREGELVGISAPRQRALLGLLLLRANEPVPQEELIDQLWGESAPPTARASLQNQVHALRRLLGPETLERQPGGYVLHVEPGELDLERFERLVAEARRAEPREKAAKLRTALALWRGVPLVEFPSEPFAQPEIARLEEERLTALEDRIDVDLELGEHTTLVPELESLVDRYRLRERIWGQLMLALYRAGRQADALAAYRRAHHAFVDELGVEPGVTLRELQRAVLVQDPALDDAEHRLGWTLERAASILPWHPHERAESLYEYGLALIRTGERRRAVSTLEAAARIAASEGQVDVQDRAKLYLSYLTFWTEGKSPLVHLAEVERAVELFEERGDYKGLAIALRQKRQFLETCGRADEGAQVALRGAEVAVALGDKWLEATFLAGHVVSVAVGSTPVNQALAHGEHVQGREERNDVWSAPFLQLLLWRGRVLVYTQAGLLHEARSLAARAETVARGAGLLWQLLDAIWLQGEVELGAGNLGEAADLLRAAHAISETDPDHVIKPEVEAKLACVLALSGDSEEATRLASSTRATTTPDLFVTEVLWRRALALVAAREGRFDEARQLSDEARTRADRSDWLTFRGQTYEEAAIVHRLAGDKAAEGEALREALALYERKGNILGAGRARASLDVTTPGL